MQSGIVGPNIDVVLQSLITFLNSIDIKKLQPIVLKLLNSIPFDTLQPILNDFIKKNPTILNN
jgi:hypothetical protein